MLVVTTNVEYSIIDLSKALLPVLGTFSARQVRVSRFLHSAKAYPSIIPTPEPIVMETRPLQPLYLEAIDSQLFIVITVEKWIGCYLWVYGK